MSNGSWRFFYARMSHKWYTDVPEMSPSGNGKPVDWYQKGGADMYGFNQMPSYQRQEIKQVNGFGGADAYQLPPNSSVLLLDQEKPVVYMKTTDGGGYPSVAAYELTPVKPPQPVDATALEERLNRLEALIRESITKQDDGAGSKAKPRAKSADAE